MSFLAVVGKSVRRLQLGALTVDLDNRVIRSGATPVPASPAEFDVLTLLLTHRNVPMSKEHITQVVFGPEHGRDPRQIDMFVARLGRSFALAGLDPVIATVGGRGYAVLDEGGTADPAPRLRRRVSEKMAA